jgi:hypothetical protein
MQTIAQGACTENTGCAAVVGKLNEAVRHLCGAGGDSLQIQAILLANTEIGCIHARDKVANGGATESWTTRPLY